MKNVTTCPIVQLLVFYPCSDSAVATVVAR